MSNTAQKFELIIRVTASQAVSEIKKSVSSIRDNFTRAKLAGEAFNKVMRGGVNPVSALTGQIRNLVGAVVGLAALKNAVGIIKNAESALFNMASSVEAANREFENVGSLETWEANVSRLSKELRIYSESSLKNAISRTVDMTKRLGLSADQMEEVIKRSADLGAGKTDLEGAIERVTAALRGEAEASEYLGLTLNENYVKAWYEASAAHGKAWKDLTDLEKAQVRYNAFLAQSEQLQGRAAKSADTFGGALMMVRKEIEDAIVNNRDVAASMSQIAQTLRDNADDIGDLASSMLSMSAAVIEFAANYKGLLLVIGGTSLAVMMINGLAKAVNALNAAFAVMTGMTIVQWIGSLRLALVAVTAQTTALSIAFQGFIAFAAAQGIYNIIRLTKALWDWRDATRELKEAQDELASQKAWIDPQIAAKLKEISEQTGIAIKSFERFEELRKKGVIGYDQSTGKYFKSPEKQTATKSTPLSDAEQKKIAADQLALDRQLAVEMLTIAGAKWEALKEQARQHYEDQLAQAHGNKQMLAQVEELYAQTLADIEKRSTQEAAEKKQAVENAWHKNALAQMQAYVETSLAHLDASYQRGEIAMAEYFDKRKTLIQERVEDEIAELRRLAEAEGDPAEKMRIETEIYEKEQAMQRELLDLANQRANAEKQIADNRRQATQILSDLRSRTAPATPGMDASYTAEQAEMDQRHQEEIQRLIDLRATEDQINDAFRLQQLEKDRLLADQEKRIFEQRLQNASTIAGGMSDVFQSLYELTGEKQKEFFYLAKAAALAEAIINTAAAVTKALEQGGPFAGPALAAVMAAKGAVQIAMISAQKLAGGGLISGSSPNDRADNVPVWATANEFMQPVSAVKYYGVQAMEAIRRRLVPRELLAGFSLGGLIPQRPSYALADGGSVPSAPAKSSSDRQAAQLNIFNYVDPAEVRRAIMANDGDAVLNVISSQRGRIRRLLR